MHTLAVGTAAIGTSTTGTAGTSYPWAVAFDRLGVTAGTSTTGWVVGYTIGIVIVLVVVALVVPILLLARSIGNEAPKINEALTQAVRNTAPLGALRTTIEHATIIIGGLQRGRARLGG